MKKWIKKTLLKSKVFLHFMGELVWFTRILIDVKECIELLINLVAYKICYLIASKPY